MTTSRILFLFAVSLVVSFAASAPARAQQAQPGTPPPTGPEAQAAALYEQGTVDYSLGKYDQAIAAFEDAYKLTKAPGFLYNIAQARRQKGDCPVALQLYQRYLQEDPQASNRGDVETLIKETQRCVDQQKAEEASRKEALQPKSTVVTREVSPPGRGKRLVGLTLAGAAVGLAGAGLWASLKASSLADEVTSDYQAGGTWDEAHAGIEARGQTWEKVSIGLFVAAGVTGAVGAGLTIWGYTEKDVTVSPMATSAGPGLSVAGRF